MANIVTSENIATHSSHERLRDAARELKISESTLRAWLRSGRVRYSRLGQKLIVIPRAEIDRLLAS